jgi:hypothetical protein
VPICAKHVRFLALALLGACLNPMPEELPSNDDSVVNNGVSGGSVETDTNERPSTDDSPPGFLGEAGSGDSATENPPAQPPEAGSGDQEAPAARDAGADAGAPSVEDTSPEDTSAEGEPIP